MRVGLAAVLVVGACGSSTQGTVDSSPPNDGDAATQPDGSSDTWHALIERPWQLAATGEDYRCRRIKVTEDTYIVGFRAEAPAGTHHAILTMAPDPGTLSMGDYDCNALATDSQMLFAGGIGMGELMFPAGVAIKVPANYYINLNLHIDTRGMTTLSGKSGIYVKTVPAATVQHEADVVFLGTIKSSNKIPANSTKVIKGECQSTGDWHIVGVVPHMHDIAVQQTIKDLNPNLTLASTILDTSYTVAQQHAYAKDIVVPLDHHLTVDCTYVNGTGTEYTIGDSVVRTEQCLAGLYRWPKQTGIYADKYSCAQF